MNETYNLLQYLPSLYRDTGHNNEVFLNKIIGQEIKQAMDYVEELEMQRYVDTATWGLIIWEMELGLPIEPNLSTETRRGVIKSKLAGRGRTTLKVVKDMAEIFSEAAVEVKEYPSKFLITIKFTGKKGVPERLDELIIALEEVLPAHIDYEFIFTKLTWNEFDSYRKTWDNWESLNLSWDQLEVYDEKKEE